MSEVKVINVNVGVFEENNKIADQVRAKNASTGTFLVNVMASPGAGKTSVLLRTIAALKDTFRIGVKEAGIDATVDAEKMKQAGVRSIQVHTGGECAMDAAMTMQAIDEFGAGDLDLLFLENVGNLVCPAEQDTGSNINVEILSVPEGDDKPLKYPLMFQVCQCILVNRIDTRKYFPFDDAAFEQRIHDLNPDAKIIFLSAKTLEGFEEWISWLRRQIVASGKKVGGQE